MAAADHNPSRRALLGAAVGLSFDAAIRQAQPLVGMSGDRTARGPLHHAAHGPPPRSGEDRWRRALAAFEQTGAELRAFERLTEGASVDEEAGLQDGHDRRIDAFCAALRRLLRTPAPDLAALAAKIELAIDHDAGGLDGGGACLAVLRRDARRLAERGTAG